MILAKQMAITIDDLPIARKEKGEDSLSTHAYVYVKVLKALKKYDVQATGYVIGNRVNGENIEFLKKFQASGHTLGNHTFSHPNLNSKTVSAKFYTGDIHRCQKLEGISLTKSFRYPYLAEGNTQEKKRAVRSYLKVHGYTYAPVSIVAFDWEFGRKYNAAVTEKEKQKIGENFVEFVMKKSEDMYRLGKPEMKHVLLLHMNHITADYLEKILERLKKKGWSFTTIEDAAQDPIYQKVDDCFGKELGTLERLGYQKN